MSVCNIFKKFDDTNNNGQGIFLTFSQYAEDLTSQNADPNNYRVVPSKFICANTGIGKLSDYDNDPNVALPYVLQSYYENQCAALKDDVGNFTWTPESARDILFKSISKFELIGDDDYVCWGDINVVSNRTITGTNYDEIYCLVEPDSPKMNLMFTKATSAQDYTIIPTGFENIILGWSESGNTQYPVYPSGTTLLSEVPIFDVNSDYLHSGMFHPTILENVNPTQGTDYNVLDDDDSFQFNTILVFYDIYTGTNTDPTYKGVPLGIWFSGPYEYNALTNPVTKFVRSDTVFGQGTSYGLRICLKNVSSPYGVDIAVELTDVEEPVASLSELCDVFAQSVVSMNALAAATNMNMIAMKDWASQFVNARVNVPYIREIGEQNYWFVNGRNIGPVEVIVEEP